METESRELAAISRSKIKAGSTDDWKSEQLFVPPLPPTNLRGCHLIRIQYDVFVSQLYSPLFMLPTQSNPFLIIQFINIFISVYRYSV